MQTVTLGRTGLRISRLVLGGYPFGGVNRAHGWDPFSTDGRRTVIATINHAIDRGITYIDTAPSYGDGNSETLIGQVMRSRREECVLATKVGWEGADAQSVVRSVHESLRRLQTDHLDLVQIHGGIFSSEDCRFILDGGPLEGLRDLQRGGKVRFIGITAEEPWTARPFLREPDVSVLQIAYNLIYQSAARGFLDEATDAGLGLVTMRTMTSGIFQRAASMLAPEWQQARDLYEVCLRFVLADSRIHAPIVGMRWPSEVDRNVELVEAFRPDFDLADLPRLTAQIYEAEDAD